jgi:hypothetical protein
MPLTTGSATNYRTLLDALRVFLLANGWSLNAYDVTATTDELYVNAPGLNAGAGDEVYVHIKTRLDTANSFFNWECKGAIGYATPALNKFYNQPNQSPSVFMRLVDSPITYWFYCNNRQVKIVAKVGLQYRTLYAGLFNAYANPIQQPYPYYLASDCGTLGTVANSDAAIRSFCDPGLDGAYFLGNDNTWNPVANHKPDTLLVDNLIYSYFTSTGEPYNFRLLFTPDTQAVTVNTFVLPFSNGLTPNTSSPNTGNPFWVNYRTRPAPSLNYNLTQCELLSYSNGGLLGALEGVYQLPGFGSPSPESLINISGTNYRVFPNINRTEYQHYFAIEEV